MTALAALFSAPGAGQTVPPAFPLVAQPLTELRGILRRISIEHYRGLTFLYFCALDRGFDAGLFECRSLRTEVQHLASASL